jgi:hypothetical protein
MKRHMHLKLFIHSRGHREAAWRHPAASPLALSDLRYSQALARLAEAGVFAAAFAQRTRATRCGRIMGWRHRPASSHSPRCAVWKDAPPW